MTHGSLHIKNILPPSSYFEVKLHTVHDGNPINTFSDCVMLPFWIVGRLPWPIVMCIENLSERYKTPSFDQVMEFFSDRVDNFQIEPTRFASLMISRYFDKWFPLPLTDIIEDLEHWGVNNPDVIVEITCEGTVKVKFARVDETSQMDYLETLEDLQTQIHDLLPIHKHLFHIDKAEYTVTYNFNQVVTGLVHQHLNGREIIPYPTYS
jgi:hypothetical protein